MKPLLEVVDLCVNYAARLDEREVALSGVSFVVERGETLGVLGESESGKSTLAAALLRILHAKGKTERGHVNFEGQDLMQLNACAMQRILGRFIASIFQEPLIALHPAIRVGQQVENVLAAHQPARPSNQPEQMIFAPRPALASSSRRISCARPKLWRWPVSQGLYSLGRFAYGSVNLEALPKTSRSELERLRF